MKFCLKDKGSKKDLNQKKRFLNLNKTKEKNNDKFYDFYSKSIK